MNKIFTLIKKIILAALILSVAVSTLSCVRDSEQEARLEEYEARLATLVYRKQQLMKERDNLESEMEKALGNTAYMSFLFTEIDSALYTDVYPVMSEGDIKLVGVMAFSEGEIPGAEGKITPTQYGEMMDAGWGDALYWNGEGDLSLFITLMRESLAPLGIDLPKTLVFKIDAYIEEYDATLAAHGIENAVHSGEGELDVIESDEPVGVWHPGRIGWRWLGKSTLLKRAVESEGGYAMFEVAFDNAKEHSHTSYFPIEGEINDSNRTAVFARMVEQFKSSIADGDVEVLNVEDTRRAVEKYYSDREMMEAENELRRAEIKAAIQEIEREMTELYNEYH